MSASILYALSGRFGDDGGRYLPTQRKQMMERAWAMHRAGQSVQAWRVDAAGRMLCYDGKATQRVTDYIVAGQVALRATPASREEVPHA